ncbi:hypothetical protein PHISCL_08626 [Aspergillus sclerotialis]|uniref:Uncharacterized protein n=1 Tax=Aspergillus sclerotialis TaxID=2070753 RepID=A0A3A2Z9Y5_9EURO|nr:hypothetical protein PHISCL_08626 [Aspergillus sclerotialis]
MASFTDKERESFVSNSAFSCGRPEVTERPIEIGDDITLGSASNPIVIPEDWYNEIDRASSVADTEIATPEPSKTVIDESFPNSDEDEAIGSPSIHAPTRSPCEDLKCPRLSARLSSPANSFHLDENALTESASGVRYSGLEPVRREDVVKGQAATLQGNASCRMAELSRN